MRRQEAVRNRQSCLLEQGEHLCVRLHFFLPEILALSQESKLGFARGGGSPEHAPCSSMSDSATPWTVAHQPPLFMGFFRQEHRSGLPCPPPGDLSNPVIEPVSLTSPALADRFFTTSTTWEAHFMHCSVYIVLIRRGRGTKDCSLCTEKRLCECTVRR